MLLEQRIGILGVAIHEARSLDVGDRGKRHARAKSNDVISPAAGAAYIVDGEERAQVILMVGLIGSADHAGRARWKVMQILRGGEVVERLVMADVVLLDRTIAGFGDRAARCNA